jgi:hypothetical protein
MPLIIPAAKIWRWSDAPPFSPLPPFQEPAMPTEDWIDSSVCWFHHGV